MAYTPDFSRNPKGKFNPLLNFVSLKGGTDAYLLEDELNELQWIQTENQAALIRAMTRSGCLQKSCIPNSNEPGAVYSHKYLIRDEHDVIVRPADVITSVDDLNNITINPFDAVLNGYLAHIESTSEDGLKIKFTDPYPASKQREDLVILEFWFRELRPHDNIPLYGGIENEPVDFAMLDYRIAMQTTNRVQLQWRIRVVDDDIDEILPHYDNGNTDISELKINPQGPRKAPIDGYIYTTDKKDPFLFVAGDGMNSVLTTDTIDGYIYAIPLFEVSRLNIAGYDAYHNPAGGRNWKDETSISDRVSTDGKFANVIYINDINDQRYQAYLGTKELDLRYVTYKVYNKKMNDFKNQIDMLSYLTL